MLVLLLSTSAPLLAKNLYADKMQQAQLLLLEMAGADADGDSAKSVKRKSLHARHASAEEPNPLAIEMVEMDEEDSA